jgi:hypothetical protein
MGSWNIDFEMYDLKLIHRLLYILFYVNNTDVAKTAQYVHLLILLILLILVIW